MISASSSSLLRLKKTEFEALFNSAVAAGGIVFTAEMTCIVAKMALAALTETASYNRTGALGIAITTVLASRLIKKRPTMDPHAIDVGVLSGLAVSCQLSFLALPVIAAIVGGAAVSAVVAGSLVARKAQHRQTID